MNLSDLHSPADIKKMSVQELGQLSAQIRMALLKKLSIHGGHIGRISAWSKLQ